ncbi:MAG: hypothetical protein A2091_09085 [Desulfuromonadales bacterium GWD2_61_12]|nr:MAG: hypothetical protein A2091_09085 [Desulfuromonadales bacterium GWD2_61_12]
MPYLFLIAASLAPLPAEGVMEHRYVYFPDRNLVATPALFDLPYEEVVFAAADGVRLHGWYLPGATAAPLILFCQGNAGNVSYNLENLAHFRRLGAGVFIFDYRGYGRSEGRASEAGTYADARGALAWLEGRGLPRSRMLYFGRSLGAAVALQLAIEAPPAGLVLETPFTSLAALGRRHYPLLHFLFGWLLDARYDNLAKIGEVHVPLLLFQGDRDTIVPEAMARQLFDRANPPKRFYLIRGADHNDTYDVGGAPYWEAWRRFLREVGDRS